MPTELQTSLEINTVRVKSGTLEIQITKTKKNLLTGSTNNEN